MLRALLAVASMGVALVTALPAQAQVQIMPAGRLSGSYVAPVGYPRVFETRAKALEFLKAARTDPSKAMVLKRLAGSVKILLPTAANYETPYTGCDIAVYTKQFSVAPMGAAVAADRLALYAYLTSLGQGFGDATLGAAAQTAAETIMAAWAQGSFKIGGTPTTSYTAFCSAAPTPPPGVWASVGLQIGRGMVEFTNAVDLLRGANAPPSFIAVMDPFIARMLNLEIGATNQHYSYATTGCGQYDNQASMQQLALAVMARYAGRSDVIEALAGVRPGLLAWSFPQQVEGNIYGSNDMPRTCAAVTFNRPGLFRQSRVVAAGEIVDRYRAEPYQPFGYTLGSLTTLELVAKILQSSGYDARDYVGSKGQSLQAALDYYSWYITTFLSSDAVHIPDSGYSYPDFSQYAGDALTRGGGASIENKDDLETPYLFGTTLYPADAKISGVLARTRTIGGAENKVPFAGLSPLFVSAW